LNFFNSNYPSLSKSKKSQVELEDEEAAQQQLAHKHTKFNHNRRNSYSLNFLHVNSLKAPENGYSAKNTRSLSAIPHQLPKSASNLGLSAKAAVDMLRKSYSRLFSSSRPNLKDTQEARLSEEGEDAAALRILVPTINTDFLKAPKVKRTRSNSPSLFAIKSEQHKKGRRSSSITNENNKVLVVEAEKKLGSGDLQFSSLDRSNNNFLSVANHAGHHSNCDM